MTRGDLNHRQSVHTAARHSKMGDWNFLGGILEEVHIHSTVVGKIWLTVLFVFRMLVLGVAAEDVWSDEQAEFVCNTEQPGCRNVCYDRAFPVSPVRLWVLQVVFVSSPSLAYMGHALYRLRALEKERRRRKLRLRQELDGAAGGPEERRRRLERELRSLEVRRPDRAPLRGALLRSYVAQVVARSAAELGFMAGQHLLYGFRLEPLYRCERPPCPNAVDCYVSRPTEKSFFMGFMQGIAGVSLLLSLLEILHLSYRRMKNGILDYCPHLREDPEDCYRVSTSSAVGGPKMAAAPYGLPPEKLAPVNPPSSAFTVVRGDGKLGVKDGAKDGKEAPPSPAKGDGKWKTAKDAPPAARLEQEAGPDEGPAHPPRHSKKAEPPGSLLQPAAGGRKPRRVSAPSSCAPLPEGKPVTAASGVGGARTRPASGRRPRPSSSPRSDAKRPGRSRTPESVEEWSSESRRSPRKLFPGHRMSLVSNASSRWAATDLRI